MSGNISEIPSRAKLESFLNSIEEGLRPLNEEIIHLGKRVRAFILENLEELPGLPGIKIKSGADSEAFQTEVEGIILDPGKFRISPRDGLPPQYTPSSPMVALLKSGIYRIPITTCPKDWGTDGLIPDFNQRKEIRAQEYIFRLGSAIDGIRFAAKRARP